MLTFEKGRDSDRLSKIYREIREERKIEEDKKSDDKKRRNAIMHTHAIYLFFFGMALACDALHSILVLTFSTYS